MPVAPSTNRFYQALTDTEQRIMASLHQGLDEVKSLIRDQRQVTDELAKQAATRTELGELMSFITRLNLQVQEHLQGAGHEITNQRITSLEGRFKDDTNELKARPIQVWQIVTAVAFILLGLCSLSVSGLTLILHILGK